MSLFSEITEFKKGSLKPTQTTITTAAGDQYVETKDEYGRLKQTRVATGATPGYLKDLKSDLQVGEILPGLIFGKGYMTSISVYLPWKKGKKNSTISNILY